MTRSYSMDLREHVVAAVAGGRSRRAVAQLFQVAALTVVRWTREHRVSGNCAPRPMGGRRHFVLLAERDWLLARISAAPDLTVRALRAELIGRGTEVSYGAVWEFLATEGLTYKKALHAAEQERPDVARKRARWKRLQGRIDAAG